MNQIIQPLDLLYPIVVEPQTEQVVILRDSLRHYLQESLIL